MSRFVEEEEEESDTSSEEQNALIQLGFIEKRQNALFYDPDWTKWDGGIVGGFPKWLDYAALPSADQLMCTQCNEPLTFLLQIYSPLDHIESAFHRAIYVFCCKKPGCLSQATGFKCLRVQLSRINDLYCYEPSELTDEDRTQFKGKLENRFASLCGLCRCKATSACSQCKKTKYCGRQHQRLHWKTHKKSCLNFDSIAEQRLLTDALDEAQERNLFPSYEIIVEAEPAVNDAPAASGQSATELSPNDILQQVPPSVPVWEDAVTPGGRDEEQDANLTQADYNKALSENRYDPVYISFLTRLQRPHCGQQVLRYCDTTLHRSCSVEDSRERELTQVDQERGRLYVSKLYKGQAERGQTKVPRCSNCGSPRAFEFQIMPQLLYYLGVEKNTKIKRLDAEEPTNPVDGNSKPSKPSSVMLENKKREDLDWGTIDIYTCIGNCSPAAASTSAYLEEHIELQQLPDLVGDKSDSNRVDDK